MTSQPSSGSNGTDYILYHNYYSICSIMMRYLLRIRGEPADEASRMNFSEQEIDIFHEEQISENYLLKVNPNGQVPVLGSPRAFSFPLAQTTAISAYISARYPSLLPKEHAESIESSLKKMHELNFFTLSFTKSPKLAQGFADGVLQRLNDKDISDDYRKALEYKLMILRRDKVSALTPEKTAEEIKKATEYMEGLVKYLKPDAGPWMFGQTRPSALDAHLVVMIARLEDVGRGEIVPSALKEYSRKAESTREWIETMQGRRTMFDGSGKKDEKK